MHIVETIRRLDIFGQSISFNFRKEETYRTSFGGIMSLAMIALIVSFFYSNIISFFAMTSVTWSRSDNFDPSPSLLNISSTDLMFGIRVSQTDFINQPMFNLTLEQRHYHIDEKGVQTYFSQYLDLVPCTIDHFQPVYTKYGMNVTDDFIQNNLDQFLCPNQNITNFLMGGIYQSTDYYFMKISVKPCVNQTKWISPYTWKPVCTPTSNITQQMASSGSFNFQFYTTNFIVNPQAAHDPVKPYIASDQFYSFAPNQLFVQSNIYWKSNEVTTDTGIFMYPQKKTIVYPVRDNGDFREQIQNAIGNTTYAAFYPQRSQYSYVVTRSYLRLDGLLSYLGGFLQFVIVVLGIIVRLYNYSHLVVQMANDLFDFETESSNVQHSRHNFDSLLFQSKQGRAILKSKRKLDSKSQQFKSNNASVELKAPPNQSDRPNINNIHQSMVLDSPKALDQSLAFQAQTKRGPTKITILQARVSEYYNQFKQLISQKLTIGLSMRFLASEIFDWELFLDDKSMMLRRASKQIQKELDVAYILKQLYEIQKIKQVLFSKEQTQLFNFIRKPKIKLHIGDQISMGQSMKLITASHDVQDDKPDNEMIMFNTLVNAYRTITTLDMEQMSDEQIRFNTRLIALLGSQIPGVIEQEIAHYQESNVGDEDSENISIPEEKIIVSSKRE